jgi:hypothetical protein
MSEQSWLGIVEKIIEPLVSFLKQFWTIPYYTVLFPLSCRKFKKLPKDRQDFLISVHEKSYDCSTEYYQQYYKHLFYLQENGFITKEVDSSPSIDDYDSLHWIYRYYYNIAPRYKSVLKKYWEKANKEYLDKTLLK